MSTVRESIAEMRQTLAKRMRIGAGYEFDWAAFYDGPITLEPIASPAHAYMDPTDELTEVVFPLHSRTLTVEEHGTHFAPDEAQHYPIGRRMVADLERNIKSDITVGGLAVDCTIRRSDIFAMTPTDDRVTVSVVYDITYRTHAEDPNQVQ